HKFVEIAFFRLERAVVDLQLLGIKTVNDISGRSICSNVVGEVERNQRQRHGMIRPEREMTVRTRWEIRIGHSVIERARRLVDQRSVIRSLVVLAQCIETLLQSVRARKLAIERIEAPVLLINNDDMPQPLHRVLAPLALAVWRTGKRATGGRDEYCRSRRNGAYAFHK